MVMFGYFAATSCAKAAKASDPVTRSLTPMPERYAAAPTDTWMMPSDSASANPFSAAFSVCELLTLMAG